jgi:hypothetical protein
MGKFGIHLSFFTVLSVLTNSTRWHQRLKSHRFPSVPLVSSAIPAFSFVPTCPLVLRQPPPFHRCDAEGMAMSLPSICLQKPPRLIFLIKKKKTDQNTMPTGENKNKRCGELHDCLPRHIWRQKSMVSQATSTPQRIAENFFPG